MAKSAYKVGEKYIVRTVTFHFTGKLKLLTDGEMVLSDAAWIADSGRWTQALKDGTLSEVEPYPGDVIISRASIVDVCVWTHDLPRLQK
jgi:hypothetical protein